MGEKQCLILYTSSECSRCKIIKQMLDESHVEYKEVVDNNKLMIEKDLYSVPALEIGDKIIDEYTSVLCWLNQNGYYSLSLWNGDVND